MLFLRYVVVVVVVLVVLDFSCVSRVSRNMSHEGTRDYDG